MRDRTRDLEQIQERETEDGPRRAGTILVATLAVVALTFALGLVVGRAEELPASGGGADDPLDRLTAPTPDGKPPGVSANGGVEATELTFPEALTGEEDRPEVLAALRAAALEEESLDGEPSAPGGRATLPAGTAAAKRRDGFGAPSEVDPLAAHANGEHTAVAAPGEPGEFMLQVLSYDDAEAAQKFARELRGHGHGAFVAVADVPGRGRTWRVRIGPFSTMREAEAYRRAFEDAEAMNSFVVRRRDEE